MLVKLGPIMNGAPRNQIVVVGAVIVRDGLVLCAQRGPEGSLPGFWEFPGGKVESGESKPEALRREISEELGCGISVGNEITTTVHDYEFGTVHLTTFYCQLEDGEPSISEHSEMQWLKPSHLASLEWAHADIPAINIISSEFA